MAQIPEATVEHYRQMQRLQLLVVQAGRRAWRRVDQRFISESWREAMRDLLPVIAGAQVQAALSGSVYSAPTLAEQDTYVPPQEFTDPAAFGGYASDGRDLDGLIYSPATSAKSAVAGGATASLALASGQAALDAILSTVVADAGRQAAGVDITTRQAIGYTRMLNPPSCSRCTVLAGRFYRWNTGFLRHPRCDCVHVASRAGSTQAARNEGLIDDPYQYFESLTEAEQDAAFTKAGAQAIRDGADVPQVVNARRGMTPNGNFTVEGTTRRGYAGQQLKPGQRRMTPELIYRQADGDRGMALRLLREHGYVLPQGQVAGGALRGQIEGYGALGRGGTRTSTARDVLEARLTGVRDPRNRNTMTAAERRLYDAERRYEIALSGIDPYLLNQGFGQTPDPFGLRLNRGSVSIRPATPEVVARAEQQYRAYLASGGQIFTE